ncbi:PREDICTED: putative FBD-associated F-box protein At5g56700 [Camelina sativa]|uniref:FBD-associated F-box protein At5g56700 n=1 Tax=Camelina sativa TaxID=90675 RepID=A0ABM1QM23_CAMSA|nr:PREDICTED: putative FBD-associated F-box protein At5g56700 [Camelina sativa]
MAKISDLSDELLVKILSFLPTEEAVSTSLLSKQWKYLWMWSPKLEFSFTTPSKSACLRDFIAKNLPLHKAPIIESLVLCSFPGAIQPEDLDSWVGTAVSRCLRELSIDLYYTEMQPFVSLPCCLYSCNSLVTLKLDGQDILVDVPPTVCLPSLKNLELLGVLYSNNDSLRLLLSCCPVLEDLIINREDSDDLTAVVIIVPSLQRLTLNINRFCSYDGYEIVTPSLKFLSVHGYGGNSSYMIEHMPELEEADISVMLDNGKDTEMLLKSITAVKRLSFRVGYKSGEETVYRDGIVFKQLKKLKLRICSENWSKLLVQLLKDSPNLKILNLLLDDYLPFCYQKYEPVGWSDNHHASVPKCFSSSLETFKFEGYVSEKPEDRDFLSFIFKHSCCLKSTSIVHL